MSVRGAEDAAVTTGSETGERRAGAGQRVQFEALVAMAESQGGSGFEAESMDVSPEGMRLRTAYLPQIGDKLVCRFDTSGSEVSTTGEVIWRNEQSRGGEFGIRFTDLTRDAAESLRSVCASMMGAGPDASAEKGSQEGTARGTRVRLHIEGLGSPMKARVREADTGEVLVGSNLEFLRVGRSLELEDVDHGVRREAHIDHVRVEIDPGTSVPQLIVALRYDDDKKAAASATPKSATKGKASEGSRDAQPARRSRTSVPHGDAAGSSGDDSPSEAAREPSAGAEARPSRTSRRPPSPSLSPSLSRTAGSRDSADDAEAEAEAAGDDGRDDIDDSADASDEGRADKLRGFGLKAASAGRAVAGKVAPSFAAVSAKTKGAIAGLLAAFQRKRAERSESQQSAAAPRRMTAPPPTGALRSEGRKLIRDDAEEEDGMTPLPPRTNKKAAVMGSAVGLVAVLAIFGVTRLLGLNRAEPASTTAAAEGTEAAAALPSSTAAALAPPASTGTLTAEVPLFGATPLSTTEPVPSMPPGDAAAALAALPGAVGAAAAPGTPGAMQPGLAAAGDPGAAMPGESTNDANSGDDGDDSGAGDSDAVAGRKEWGQGKVRNPVVLKLKMDGPIETVNGASGAMGFTVSLPDRRSVSATSDLARKDKRIASLHVVNTAHGAEVTVQFKDGVPAYKARAKGDRLEIALGTEGRKKVASKKPVDKKKSTAADKKKKDAKAKGKKKPADR